MGILAASIADRLWQQKHRTYRTYLPSFNNSTYLTILYNLFHSTSLQMMQATWLPVTQCASVIRSDRNRNCNRNRQVWVCQTRKRAQTWSKLEGRACTVIQFYSEIEESASNKYADLEQKLWPLSSSRACVLPLCIAPEWLALWARGATGLESHWQRAAICIAVWICMNQSSWCLDMG